MNIKSLEGRIAEMQRRFDNMVAKGRQIPVGMLRRMDDLKAALVAVKGR